MTLAALVEKARKSKVAATALEDAALDLLLAGQLEQVFHGTAYTVNTYLKSLPHARCVAQERPAPLPWADLVRAHVSSAPKIAAPEQPRTEARGAAPPQPVDQPREPPPRPARKRAAPPAQPVVVELEI